MKINYPIKYSVMPIIDQSEKNDIVCYIVSKCYVINDIKRYEQNGKCSKKYEVVFPYQLAGNGIYRREEPSFNYYNDNCTNSNIVDCVFDTYEEAVKIANEKNIRIYEGKISYLSFDELIEKMDSIKKEYSEKLKKYKLLEQQILLETSNLKINESTVSENAIKVSNGKRKVTSVDLYKLIQIYTGDEYFAYTISEEQYDKLVKVIHSKSGDIDSIIKGANILLVGDEKDNSTKVINSNGEDVYYIDKDNILRKEEIPTKLSKPKFENPDIFYTTETFDDVVGSYKIYKDIDLDNIESLYKMRKEK